MGETGRVLVLGVLVVAVLAAVGSVYVLAPDLFRGEESSPEDVVRGFLEALNAKDWDGVVSRLSKDAREKTIPEDEAAVIVLRTRIWMIVDRVGPFRFELSEAAVDGEVALVPADVEGRLVGRPLRRSGTFHLIREEDAWRLVAKVTLDDGRVVDSPLELIGMARPPSLPPR